ncbi:MAG: hypothetical protein ACKVJQ_12410 [Alphaproteobacteria bacterium]|jgi:hypothetical protein
MATKPKTKKPAAKTSKPKAPKAKAPDAKESKTPDSGTDSGSDSGSDSKSDSGSEGSSKKASAPSRPISYFSSVATDDYRSGWDEIFGKKKAAPRKKKLPATITLGADDLDQDLRDQLETAFRKQVKKKRLNYDKLDANDQISWEIACHISED